MRLLRHNLLPTRCNTSYSIKVTVKQDTETNIWLACWLGNYHTRRTKGIPVWKKTLLVCTIDCIPLSDASGAERLRSLLYFGY